MCQNVESPNTIEYYELPFFERFCKNTFFYDKNIKTSLNCGVFGGKNFDFIDFYVDSAFALLLDQSNEEYWSTPILKMEGRDFCWQAGFLEQYWLSQCVKRKNIKPNFVFDDDSNWKDIMEFQEIIEKEAKELGYTHLWASAKNQPEVIAQVSINIKKLKKELGLNY